MPERVDTNLKNNDFEFDADLGDLYEDEAA
jgi:hypothetical protein